MSASATRGAALKKERVMKMLLIITDGMTTGPPMAVRSRNPRKRDDQARGGARER
jgi:hypothetical protein